MIQKSQKISEIFRGHKAHSKGPPIFFHSLAFNSFTPNSNWRFCLISWIASAVICSSSITKWVARISQERFYIESPNFIRTYTPTHSRATLDMTSTATSGRHLSKFGTNGRKCRLRRLWVEFAFCLAQPIGGLLVYMTECARDRTQKPVPSSSGLIVAVTSSCY